MRRDDERHSDLLILTHNPLRSNYRKLHRSKLLPAGCCCLHRNERFKEKSPFEYFTLPISICMIILPHRRVELLSDSQLHQAVQAGFARLTRSHRKYYLVIISCLIIIPHNMLQLQLIQQIVQNLLLKSATMVFAYEVCM